MVVVVVVVQTQSRGGGGGGGGGGVDVGGGVVVVVAVVVEVSTCARRGTGAMMVNMALWLYQLSPSTDGCPAQQALLPAHTPLFLAFSLTLPRSLLLGCAEWGPTRGWVQLRQ